MKASHTEARSENQTLIFVALVVFLDLTGVGIILPIMPDLIVLLTGSSNASAAEWGGWLTFAYAITLFFAAPVLGAISDQVGRRPVMLLALAGFALDYFFMAVAPTLVLIFLGRVIAGVCGATFPVANAAIADISSPDTRARNFGIIGAAAGAGFVLGPALGGVIGDIGQQMWGAAGVRLPFIASGILTLLAMLYGALVFPETLAREKRRRFDPARANPIGSLAQVWRYSGLIWLLLAFFFYELALQALGAIWTFYTIEVVGWSTLEIGLTVSLYGLALAIIQGGFTGPATKRWGEARVGMFSLTLGIVSYMWLSMSATSWMLYTSIAIGAFTAFSAPVLQTLMTRTVDEDQQGELQGAIASVISLSVVIGPIAMTQTFGAYADETGLYWPGAAFALAAAITAVALVTFVLGIRRLTPSQAQSPATAPSDSLAP